MPVDVLTSLEIDRPRAEVVAFAADPDNATAWYQNIKAVEGEDAEPGRTRMRLRNRGEPSGFASVAAPVMMRAMRRANRKDLERLKEILEA